MTLSRRSAAALKMLLAVFVVGISVFWFRAGSSGEGLEAVARADGGGKKIAAVLPAPLARGEGLLTSSTTGKAALNSTNATSGSATNDLPDPEVARYQFATAWRHETNPKLALFSAWAEQYSKAPANERPALEARGIALAEDRRAVIKSLIRSQPKAALASAVPAAVREQLPASVLARLEERVSAQGDFFVLARTDPQGVPAIARRAVIHQQNYEAFVYGDRAAQRTAENISLHGVALDGQLALSESPLRAFEEGETIPADKPIADESCPVSKKAAAPANKMKRKGAVAAESGTKIYWMCHGSHIVVAAENVAAAEGAPVIASAGFQPHASMGTRSILVMRVEFPNRVGEVVPTESASPNLDQVANFLHAASYGDLTIGTKTFTPVLRVPQNSQFYRDSGTGDTRLLSDARAAARAAGFSPASFDFEVVAFVDIGLPWSGQGYVGFSGAWVQGPSFFPGTAAHELGHNMGVWHANSWDGNASPTDPNGFHDEYGNIFDVMGVTSAFPNNHYSANFKRLFGWLTGNFIHTVTNTGTYRIYAQDQNARVSGRQYGIRIPVGLIAASEVQDYWIDYRQLQTATQPATADGAIVQWGNEMGTASASRLLDSHPETTTMADAPVRVGGSLADLDNGITITTLAQSGSGADAFLDVKVEISRAAISLADALDQPDWTFTTSAEGWIGQRSVSRDGIDAASTSATSNNGKSHLSTTIAGPGAVTFWWKVSSEVDFDFLKLFIDDREIARISGEVQWQQRSYEIGAGPHVVKWSYEKDGNGTGGSDRAWVDMVSFSNGDRPPVINVQPVPVVATVGEDALFTVEAGGTAPLTYQWRVTKDRATTNIPNATNTSLLLHAVRAEDAGLYSALISNPFDEIESSPALLTVVRTVPLADALDLENGQWTTSGPLAAWIGQTEVTHDNVDAAKTAAIDHGTEATLQTTLAGPGAMSFWWKASTEPDFDVLTLSMDGDVIETISGEVDWTPKSILVPNGPHVFRWAYRKDSSVSLGADAAWVDEVHFQFTPNVPPTVTTPPTPQSVSAGGAARFSVGYIGSEPLRFQWFKGTTPLAARPGVTGVNSASLTIANAQASDAGAYSVSITNDFGGLVSRSATLDIVALSLGDAMDQPTLAWATGGEAPWKAQPTTTHDGVDAAVSGSIFESQNTWLETRVSGPAEISFWWKVSSEDGFDLLTFEVDGSIAQTISGAIDWTQQTARLPEGDHALRWRYRKDASTSRGDDAAWVDQLVIVGGPSATPPLLSIVSHNADALTLSVTNLPASGQVILESSANLTNWTAVATNAITSSAISLQRATTNRAEFLRVKLP
jgi:hypothetical protein